MGDKKIIYETVTVQLVPVLEEILEEKYVHPPVYNLSVPEFLEMIADLPLKQQVCMMVNLLTCIGYKEKEIADAMNMNRSTYRKQIFLARNILRNKKISVM